MEHDVTDEQALLQALRAVAGDEQRLLDALCTIVDEQALLRALQAVLLQEKKTDEHRRDITT